MKEARDASTLETRVIEDWHPWGKDTGIRQKLIEINVCEWWPGQKVRLPVTLLAPAGGGPCHNLIIGNSGNQLKAISPAGAMLRLLKENGVGLALIGMTTIDAMEPVGKLDVGMKEHFLKTKDARFTPAWIWGMSDIRALTAAAAEKDVFQPTKVIATGGSKRGVATAAAGIADDRFTAILPVVAPIIDPPGGPYVEGTRPADQSPGRTNNSSPIWLRGKSRASLPPVSNRWPRAKRYVPQNGLPSMRLVPPDGLQRK
jgi:hypothetical protein